METKNIYIYIFIYPLVFPNIAIAGISPFLIGNTSTKHSGAPIFQPAMLDFQSVQQDYSETGC